MPEAWGNVYSPDFPEGWSYPSELKQPSGSILANLVIVILSRNIVGNDVIETLGLLLAADSRFNVWYGAGAGGGRTGRELAPIRADGLDGLRKIYEAWRILDAAFDTGDRQTFEERYSALLEDLRCALRATCARMGETIADFGDL